MLSVSIKPPKADVARELAGKRQRLDKKGKMLAKISILLDTWVKRNFASEGGKVGGWKPFKYGGRVISGFSVDGDGYLEIDESAKLLQKTGDLRLSHMPFATNKEAGIVSDLPYAGDHNYGLGHLPARRTVPYKEDVIEPIMRVVRKHTKKALK